MSGATANRPPGPDPIVGRTGRRGRGEDGQVGGLEALVFGVLVFVLGTLVVANAWGVIDAKMAVTSAAQQAARAFVQAPSEQVANQEAQAAATQALVDAGRDPSRMSVVVIGTLERCSRVVAVVRYRVPLAAVPLLGGLGSGFVASSQHSELVDPYRTGLPGQAQCGFL